MGIGANAVGLLGGRGANRTNGRLVVNQVCFRNLRPKFGGSIKIFRHIADSKTGNFQRLALGVACLGKLVTSRRNLLDKPGILLSRGRVFWRPETCFRIFSL